MTDLCGQQKSYAHRQARLVSSIGRSTVAKCDDLTETMLGIQLHTRKGQNYSDCPHTGPHNSHTRLSLNPYPRTPHTVRCKPSFITPQTQSTIPSSKCGISIITTYSTSLPPLLPSLPLSPLPSFFPLSRPPPPLLLLLLLLLSSPGIRSWRTRATMSTRSAFLFC